MNRSIFWRLVWKEYRVQRAFWLAMIVIVVLLELLIVGLSEGDRGGQGLVTTIFGLALAFSALYAAGCGATLFATERETGTFEFQRAVPVSSLRLFSAKATFALLSTSSILAVLLALAAWISRWDLPDAKSWQELWCLFGFGIVELLFWGIFFSLLLDRPLAAAILTIATVSAYVFALVVNFGGSQFGLSGYAVVLPLRAAIAVAVGVLDVLVAWRWLERSRAGNGARDLFRGDVFRSLKGRGRKRSLAPFPGEPIEPSRDVLFSRLVWQQWHQSRRMMLVVAVAAVPVVAAGVWVGMSPPFVDQNCLEIITLLMSLLAGLMGACVFLGDQWREQFRFFAERGARPGYVWLSRQLVWIAPLVLFTTLVVPLFLLAGREQVFGESWTAQWRLDQVLHEDSYFQGHPAPSTWLTMAIVASHVWYFLLCVAVAYAAGQFCSLLFRSGILAVVFGLMLGGALCGWTLLVRLMAVNSLWAALPIPLVLLLATRLRTSDWMLQRKTLRAWLRLGAIVLVPAVAIVAAVPTVRVRSIPQVDPGLLPGEYEREPTAEERATATMYQQALDNYRPLKQFLPERYEEPQPEQASDTAKEAKARALAKETWQRASDAWLKANERTIALAVAAAARPLGDVRVPPWSAYRARHLPGLYDLASLLRSGAQHEQRDGRLDQAADRYLGALRVARYMGFYTRDGLGRWIELSAYRDLQEWVAEPGQTSARIAALVKKIEELVPTMPSRCNSLKTEYLLARDVIDLNPEAIQAVELSPHEVFQIAFYARWLPWERTRALRILDYRMAAESAYCRAIEGDGDEWSWVRRYELRRYGWLWDSSAPSVLYRREPRVDSFVSQEITWLKTQRAVTQLTLAVEAWRLAHGRLPDSLDALVGPYLKELPKDPSSRSPFRYFREGFPFAVVAASDQHESDWRTVPAGTPLLASSWLDITLGRSPYGSRWDPLRRRLQRSADMSHAEADKWYAEPIYPLPQPAKSATAAAGPAREPTLGVEE